MATREELHRKVDALSEAQLERARIVVLNAVDIETSVEAILARPVTWSQRRTSLVVL